MFESELEEQSDTEEDPGVRRLPFTGNFSKLLPHGQVRYRQIVKEVDGGMVYITLCSDFFFFYFNFNIPNLHIQ